MHGVISFHAQQRTSKNVLGCDTRLEGLLLFEILVNFDALRGLQDGVPSGFVAPDELHALTERLRTPRESCVDDVLSFGHHRDELAIGIVLQLLGNVLCCAKVFAGQQDLLPVHDLIHGGLDVHLLDFAVVRHDDFPVLVHGGDEALLAELDHNSPLVAADCELVGPRRAPDGPHAFECVVQGGLQAICCHLPDLDGLVLAPRDDQWKIGMEHDAAHVVVVR
mmetsp:Transcript_70178/g.117051  ORF Transcript_70178/g.117051 Transcript_70178/m.117051 type:complete len:222 (-) Transcript_70178:726-1391(-)